MTAWNLREHRCPYCGKDLITRSKRRGFFENRILRLTPVRPYRCIDCGERHYGRAQRV